MADEGFKRKLAAILSADVEGYSRLMGEDEESTVRILTSYREVLSTLIQQHNGKVLDSKGDNLLAEFVSVVDAVQCAVSVQKEIKARNDQLPENRRMQFRIGINLGDVIQEEERIYGDGVNIAARLEGLANTGGICISKTAFDQIESKLPYGYEFLGDQTVKNIAKPVSAYRVLMEPRVTVAGEPEKEKRSPVKRMSILIGIAAVVVLAAAVGIWQLYSRRPTIEPASVEKVAFPLPEKPSIAVLPFVNLSDDPKQEYFVDGMTEDLITDLSKLSGLFVIARNSVFTYKGKPVKVKQVAQELGVKYVLEGSVRRVSDQVRINTQLINATTGGHLWAERYDGSLEDVFALQDQVTEQIVAALAVNLTDEEEAQQTRHDTDNPDAHDAYLQGWAHYRLSTPKDLARAIPFFEEAIRLDPDYAQTHAALAALYWDVYKNDWAFDLGMPSFRAEAFANDHLEQALKTPTPLAHSVQSRMFAAFGFHTEAVEEAEKAVALGPNDATALAGLAHALVHADRPGEGLTFIQDAMRLDPHYPPSYLIILGAAQFGVENYEAAVATFERAVKRNPENEKPLIYLASSYGHLSRMREAEDTIETANDLRATFGLGALSLERVDPTTSGFSPFTGEIDFASFGTKPAQARLRAGLSDIPALTWQYLITVHHVVGQQNARYEIDGGTEIDLATAKSFHDKGVVFIDTSSEALWKKGRVPGALNLPSQRDVDDPTEKRFRETTLSEIVDKSEEVVFYWWAPGWYDSSAIIWVAAKAVNWGYQKVYYFHGGTPAWKEAGYPIEKGEGGG
jgi:TolB-like protein/class 3 adenylate cyclase/Flp pilus assembly protein TadD/rhodanese-related sulfurtransferase